MEVIFFKFSQFFGSLATAGGNNDVIELPDFEPQTFLLFLKVGDRIFTYLEIIV